MTKVATGRTQRATGQSSPAPVSTPFRPDLADPPSGSGPSEAKARDQRPEPDDRPWADSRFWVLQVVVLGLALIRLATVVALNLDTTSLVVEFSTLGVFLVPVVYAALHYGLRGAVMTAAWVALLDVPRFVGYTGAHEYVAAWAEVLQVVLLGVLAFLIGQGVSAEREARRMAEAAREAHLSAEALYRELFDSNRAPILFVDGNGYVIEANAAALNAFGPDRRPGPDQREFRPVRLVDMIGPGAAAEVLTRLLPGLGSVSDDEGADTTGSDTVAPVPFEVDGQVVLYRPAVTALGRSADDRRMQVVFEDVTTETRRHDLIEAYATRVVLGQEEERRHIAQELHDGPVQSLIHLCRQIDLLGAQPSHDSDDPSLGELRGLVESAVGELRTIAQGLRPSILDDLGLVASINQLLVDAGARGGFETTSGVTGTERRFPAAVELALFRIAQEALSNVERHSAATRVAVGLDFESGALRMLIKDDGVGFDLPARRAAETASSFGLPGMTERAHLIGARITVHSAPGAGTTVDVRLPATIVKRP